MSLDDSPLDGIDMALERPGTLARQVNQILRERIRTQVYEAGARLPAESELAEEFGVSRATIRSVLARLDVEGLIIRKQGDGTYVNERLPEVNAHLGGLWEFNRLIEGSGHVPSIKLLLAQYRPAAEDEASMLGIAVGDEVLSLERTFLADDRPVIVAQNVLGSQLIKTARDTIDGSLQIREFVKAYCGRNIAYAISDIGSVLAGARVGDLLGLDAGQPLLKLSMRFYDRDNQPLLHGASYINDSLLNLRLVQAWD